MLSLTTTVCIEAPAELVWEHLARIEDIALWAPGIRSATATPGCERGVGAERVCVLSGGVVLIEHWSAWRDGVSYTYEGAGLPGVVSAVNTWTIESVGPRTLLRSDATVVFKGGPFGRLLEPMAKRQARRLGRRSLGALKHLVETGEVPRSATHVPVPASC